ncbi:hypothetical protein F511_16078 [Dorcoceras hygrometricum]|uniref:Uncharacterized protein n=1 Tax=Dorcoceras hygrometricum TaxID=472368 RepID=A0A2Z7BSC8_9LAMI|nr:hypothetical protein F511_16078 [Dorcoceras hygrometricum]
MNFVKACVIHDACESVKYDDQITPNLNHNGKQGIGYTKPEKCKPSWLQNRLEKDKAKAGSKSSVLNQQRRGSTKAKSVWIKVQPKRDLNCQSAKPNLNRSLFAFGWLLLISRRACARALKRRRLNKWKRCVLSFTFKRSAAGSKACVAKVASFGLVDASSFCVISRNQQIDCIRERAVSSSQLLWLARAVLC